MRSWIQIPVATLVALMVAATAAGPSVRPLPNAHAHNDYEHERPLLDALDHGFCSVEADIYLVDGELLVAHDREDVKPERTLKALYLDPLLERVKAHGGVVHPGAERFILLIDIKSDGAAVYAVLREELKQYAEILTSFTPVSTQKNAVTVILSGDCPRDVLAAEPQRYAAADGRTKDLETDINPNLVPLISDSWAGTFRYNRSGPMPEDIREELREHVKKAHAKGCLVRFWAVPHREDFWEEFVAAGVDLINVDDLARLRRFLTGSDE